MKQAYLILAHTNFKQLGLLCRALDYPHNDIYIHVDKKSKQFNSETLPKLKYSHIYITERIPVYWGTISQIEAELILFKSAYRSNNHYKYYHLISGEDYPIKSQDYIYNYFKNNNCNYLECSPDRENLRLRRVKYFHLNVHKEHHLIFGILRRMDKVSCLFQRLIGVDRLRDNQFDVWYGANWCSLQENFVRVLLVNESWIRKTFSRSLCGDELYKQIILKKYAENLELSSPIPTYKYALMRDIDWDRGQPYVWGKSDLDELINSPFLFARKFDDSGSEMLEKLLKLNKDS